MKLALLWLPVSLSMLVVGCGYRMASHQTALPAEIQSIAVPAFSNATTRYRLTDLLPGAITREFLSRTRYRIVSDAAGADAVLKGSVLNYSAVPNVIDQATGRATGVQVNVVVALSLVENKTGKVLWSRPNLDIRQRYEIALEAREYFEESATALERVTREVSRSVVSAVVEAF